MKIKGKIVKIISNKCTVNVDNKLYECTPRGKFHYTKETPLVGDNVLIDSDNNYILEIDKRKNELTRPMIANTDIALIITSVKNPDLSLFLLDKILCIIINNNIKPVICFTKVDLLDDDKEFNKIYRYYNSIGIDAITNTELDKLKKIIEGKQVVLTGQTGAGKSTLLNKIDNSLNLKTDEISKALGRGKHTTRHVELFNVLDANIADTPGFSSFDLVNLTKENIRDSFIEFGHDCKYRDCFHLKEAGCIVVSNDKILKSRYDNYKKMVEDYESSSISFKK